MMSNPLVSIIIPAYNLEDYIEPCVRSALGQSWKHIEVIAVDDGSTDSTGMKLDALAGEDSRLKVVHKLNGGVAKAREAGIASASGEYLAFLDADDIYYPEFIERAVIATEGGKYSLVVAGLRRIHSNGTDSLVVNKGLTALDGKGFMGLYFSQGTFLGLVNKLYRRDLLEGVESRPYRIGEDFYAGCQIAAKLPDVRFIDYIGYGYFQRAGSNVHNSFDLAFCEDFCSGIADVLRSQVALSKDERERYLNLLRVRWYITFISKSRNTWAGDCVLAEQARTAVADPLFRKYYSPAVAMMLRVDRCKSLRAVVLAIAAFRRISTSIARRFARLS